MAEMWNYKTGWTLPPSANSSNVQKKVSVPLFCSAFQHKESLT